MPTKERIRRVALVKGWVVENDGEGDFVYFDGGTPGHDSLADIYLPADEKKRKAAFDVIVKALNKSGIRI